jgi:hypothetical protein
MNSATCLLESTKMTQLPSLVRQPYAKPSHIDHGISLPSDSGTIAFRHPGYDDSSNILLLMPALDPHAGIHHMTALIACCILADNQWEGYFTEDKEGQKKVEAPEDGTLRGRNYYFHIPSITSGEQAKCMKPAIRG